MNLRILIPSAAILLLAAGCQTKAPQREIVLSLTSALPVSYSGIVVVDGKKETVSGRTPAELRFTAREVQCEITQGGENGLLTIEAKAVDLPQRVEMVTGTTGPNTTAQGEVSFD